MLGSRARVTEAAITIRMDLGREGFIAVDQGCGTSGRRKQTRQGGSDEKNDAVQYFYAIADHSGFLQLPEDAEPGFCLCHVSVHCQTTGESE